MLSMRKAPHCKKLDEYDRDHRYTYEYRNGAVRAWAKGKKRRERSYRRVAKQELAVAGEVAVRREKKRKFGVVTLRGKMKAAKGRRRLIA
jgi:hypothetical protein